VILQRHHVAARIVVAGAASVGAAATALASLLSYWSAVGDAGGVGGGVGAGRGGVGAAGRSTSAPVG